MNTALKEVKVLEAIAGPATLAEVASHVGISASDALSILSGMVRDGEAKRDGKLFWAVR